jgi:hypothetical protein
MAAPLVREPEGEGGQGLGQRDRHGPEEEPDGPIAGVDAVEGEPADGRGPLGVEQDQQPGDPVGGRDGVVVQEAAGLLPALVLVQRPGGAGPPDGGEPKPAVDAAGRSPADEVAGLGLAGGIAAGDPGIKVSLGAAGQGMPPLAEPAEQPGGGTDPLAVMSSWP